MDQTTDQIERHIRETRDDLGYHFSELEGKVRTTLDWRSQFQEHPATMMAVAFGGGILLSAVLPKVRFSSPNGATQPHTAGFYGAPRAAREPSEPSEAAGSRFADIWTAVTGALATLATSKMTDLVDEVVPGFKQEYQKKQRNSY